MNFSFKLLLGLSFSLFILSCKEQALFSDASELETVVSDFERKRQELPSGQLFKIFSTNLSRTEKEALLFLYAYMPVGDITDYSGEYYLMNVRYALRAKAEMPWGKTIPEREFRHFVLPVRVNNENLDESRKVFYEELKEKVKHLSLYDAVLEVNHWCHEKAVYSPSDSRTTSPLSTVKSACGRCGEESTFLVAALRSVGIPARQVYTPRWAHTDDNHAWVEAWVNGEWHFLGACEPEPVLDLGWFNAPASRGMLMHTKVFGKYRGPEEVMSQTQAYTEINIIGNYAPSTRATVTVVDENRQAVENARVEFKIYNYAEFYTVASKQTDAQGRTSLSAGKGDMLVWASKGDRFGYGKLSFAKENELTVVLDKKPSATNSLALDIVPPNAIPQPVEITPEQREKNTERMQQEDSIRNAYTSTFIHAQTAASIAEKLGMEREPLCSILIAGRGNHREILRFLEKTPKESRSRAVRLLLSVSAKDLRDSPTEILTDHLTNSIRLPQYNALFDAYVMNPRISNEMLTAYKTFFQKNLPSALIEQIRENPDYWKEWCLQNIRIKNELNPQVIPMTPSGVWKARVADSHSRDIFYVAVLRSLGIASRIDEVTGKTQYATENGEWQDVVFTAPADKNMPQGKLTATYRPVEALSNPLYYSHFTLSKYQNGTFRLLAYPEDKSSNWETLLKNPLSLDTGYYLLITGTRLANGSVLSHLDFFNVEKDKTVTTKLLMRENPDEVKVIGNLDAESLFLPRGQTQPQSILQTTGRGYFIIGILEAGGEPTNHALHDIAVLKQDFEKWKRSMVLLFPDKKQMEDFNNAEFPALPDNITWGIDSGNRIRNLLEENMKLSRSQLPIFVIADTFNRIVFISQGYTIGLGEQLLKTIHKL